MKTRSIAAALGLAGVAALTACGTTEPAGGDTAPAANDSADCSDVETSTGPVSLTDAFGRKVELEQPAERVAVLEWQQTEDVLSLCLSPVAVADAAGFELWNSSEELPEGVEDVGTRGEPNLEALYKTNPDLVIIEAYTPEDEIIKTLEEYDVPVLATKGADAADPIGQMKDTFELIAQATGREDRADVVLEELDTALAEAKEQVADSEVTDFVYFDGWVQGGNVAIRPFGQGSLMGELGEAIGLTNAYDGEVDPAYGLGQTDLEGLSEYGDATWFYTGTEDESGFLQKMQQNKIWTSSPAVEEGRAHAFPQHIWTFGGPRSAQQVIDAYVEVVTQ